MQVIPDDRRPLPIIEGSVRAAERVIGQRVYAIAERCRHRRLGHDIAWVEAPRPTRQ